MKKEIENKKNKAKNKVKTPSLCELSSKGTISVRDYSDKPYKNILILGNVGGIFRPEKMNSDIATSFALDDNYDWLRLQVRHGANIYIVGHEKLRSYADFLENKFNTEKCYNNFSNKFIKYLIDYNDDKELFKYFEKISQEMPKFDYIIQNPPYSGTLHIDFFNKGLDILSDSGKMVIIEPATWLINVRIFEKKSDAYKQYMPLKERVKGKVKKIIIDNLNGEFKTKSQVVSITYIDNNYYNTKFDYYLFGQYTNTDIFNCSHILNTKLFYSILNKIENKDKIINHETNKICGFNYLRYNKLTSCAYVAQFRSPGIYDNKNAFIKFKDTLNYFRGFTLPLINNDENIYITIPYKSRCGNHKKNSENKYSDKLAECIYGTQEELINYKHYVLNNTLPLFINICMTIDQHNNSLKYVPWLVDKQYTDQEIYDMFGFTQKEINLIEKTIRKFERNSPFFKRAMCGPSSVSAREVQEFCDTLDKEYPTD